MHRRGDHARRMRWPQSARWCLRALQSKRLYGELPGKCLKQARAAAALQFEQSAVSLEGSSNSLWSLPCCAVPRRSVSHWINGGRDQAPRSLRRRRWSLRCAPSSVAPLSPSFGPVLCFKVDSQVAKTVVPGSHKSNYRCPSSIKNGDRFTEYIKQVDANAGDCVIMTETTAHGTLPWVQPAYDRRSLVCECAATGPDFLIYCVFSLDFSVVVQTSFHPATRRVRVLDRSII